MRNSVEVECEGILIGWLTSKRLSEDFDWMTSAGTERGVCVDRERVGNIVGQTAGIKINNNNKDNNPKKKKHNESGKKEKNRKGG